MSFLERQKLTFPEKFYTVESMLYKNFESIPDKYNRGK